MRTPGVATMRQLRSRPYRQKKGIRTILKTYTRIFTTDSASTVATLIDRACADPAVLPFDIAVSRIANGAATRATSAGPVAIKSSF